jgi:hypothetical protein
MRDEEITRKIVQEAVKATLLGLGFNLENPHETQADLLYLRKMRKGGEEVSRFIKKSIITATIPGFLYLLWEILKQAIHK